MLRMLLATVSSIKTLLLTWVVCWKKNTMEKHAKFLLFWQKLVQRIHNSQSLPAMKQLLQNANHFLPKFLTNDFCNKHTEDKETFSILKVKLIIFPTFVTFLNYLDTIVRS